MLSIKSAQADFRDGRVKNLLSNLQEKQIQLELVSSTIRQLMENPDPDMTLEYITQLEPDGISMHYLLEQLGLL